MPRLTHQVTGEKAQSANTMAHSTPDPSVQEVGLGSGATPRNPAHEPTVIPLLPKTCGKTLLCPHCRRSTSDLEGLVAGPGRFWAFGLHLAVPGCNAGAFGGGVDAT